MTIAIYLAHLNPLTNAHVDIINELKKIFLVKIEEVEIIKENIIFKIPGKLN